MLKIAVLGAGINGVSCAVKIQEKYKNVEVVLISKEFSPNTTGDGSGGLWYPYLCGDTPEHLLTQWGIETYNYLHAMWLEGGYDIIAMPIYALYREHPAPGHSPGKWTESVFGYRELDKAQLRYMSEFYSVDYVAGHTFTTFQVLPPTMISYLHHRFIAGGGRVVAQAVGSLTDPLLDGYDVVVNCSGLGAREIVPDTRVHPIRGQIFKVNAPWVNYIVMDKNSCHYIIPNTKTCILGGTSQVNNYSREINEKDTEHILGGCRNMIPGLNLAETVNGWVGLRPGRDAIRIEAEKRGSRLTIHNYGHGGSGLTLFWGCSNYVLDILDKHLQNDSRFIKSKL